MGENIQRSTTEGEDLRNFKRCLLKDIHALEKMLEDGIVESGIRRIGAEQELVLVDKTWRPAPLAMEILEKINDPHFTHEVAKFNLEFNLDPLSFGNNCLSTMEKQLHEYIAKVRKVAQEFDTDVLLVGILPTIRRSDLNLDNMTPIERYSALNETLARMRGGAYEINIKGTDELSLKHDNLMIEGANTSFQVHFQVGPEEFVQRYNIAQVAAAPIISAAANSPFLGRYRLWKETRIAVFQQSIDTRNAPFERELSPRVHFGNRWIDESVLEIFQEDISRYKVLFASEIDEDPFEALENRKAPKLQALCLHNGTVYRWNRACYGVSEGKPHLRIENRVLPSGPTPMDEVANAAFWFGLMSRMSHAYDDITRVMEFDVAKDNFFSAARHGLDAQFHWLDGNLYTASDLILNELLPMAREGLALSEIDQDDIDKYLNIVEERVSRSMTGSQWMLSSRASMKSPAPLWEKNHALTAAMLVRQLENKPVHEWSLAKLEEGGGWKQNYTRVEQYMTTDLFTVEADDPIDLVANMMVWNRTRHVLVEDKEHNLVGLVSHRNLLRLVGRPIPQEEGQSAPVSSIMVKDPITAKPDTLTLDAIELMREKCISCLPIVNDGKLLGVVTEDRFLSIVANLLEEKLKE